MQEIQRSPSKWQTEQRDGYRYFVEEGTEEKDLHEERMALMGRTNENQSPGKGGDEELNSK